MRISLCVELENHERTAGDVARAELALPPLARSQELAWSRTQAACPYVPKRWRGNVAGLVLAAIAAQMLDVSVAALLETATPTVVGTCRSR